MTHKQPREPLARLPVQLTDEQQTSVTIPVSLLKFFCARFGSRQAFREVLAGVVKEIHALPPKSGYSRSFLVRQRLEEMAVEAP